MKHTVFALLPDSATVDETIDRIIALGHTGEKEISLIVHRDALDPAQLDQIVQHSEDGELTDAAHGMTVGVTVGSLVGGALGVLMAGPLGLFGAGPLAGLLFGAGTGTAYGLLGGALSGAGATDATLRELAEGLEEGQILIAAHAPDQQTADSIVASLTASGVAVAGKPSAH